MPSKICTADFDPNCKLLLDFIAQQQEETIQVTRQGKRL